MSVGSAPSPGRVLLVFIDGIGIGPDDPARNPFAAARLPHISRVIAGARPVESDLRGGPVLGVIGGLKPIDATLGIPGLPQSGTGQTTLLTGVNAALQLGRHFGPWVHTQLRPLLAAESLFRMAPDQGFSVQFANAYPSHGSEREEGGGRRPGAFPFAAGAASLLVHDEHSVRRGDALVSSIATERWRRYVDPAVPAVEPFEAGARLARLALEADLTIFAHYDTDYIGHRGGFGDAVDAIELVDLFLGGILAERSADTLLLMTSDHGNLEAAGEGHTRNPVPLLVVGPDHGSVLQEAESIADIAALILGLLERSRRQGPGGPPRFGGRSYLKR